MTGVRAVTAVLLLPLGLAAQIGIIVHLSAATNHAFDVYTAIAESAMTWNPVTSARPDGKVDLKPLGGSPIDVQDGMVHDWAGGVFVRGAMVEKALAMFQNYPAYKKVFAPDVIDSQALSHEGDHWNSRLRISRRSGLISVVYDADYSIQYRPLGDGRWVIQSRSTKISELNGDKKP